MSASDATHSTVMGSITVTVPCMNPGECSEHAHLVNCPHETDSTGEYTCNLPGYVCDYRDTYTSDPSESYLRSLTSERRAIAASSVPARGNSAVVTSQESAGMAHRSIRGMIVRDTRTGDCGK